ncbi:MAG: HTTM domain-containing protein [Enhygromyxa sp.]
MALTQLHARIHRFNTWLQTPEDGAGLAIFRVAFGLAMAWDAWQYLSKGWAWTLYSNHAFMFKYWGFGWVEPLSANGMAGLYVGMFIASLLVAFGAFYRAAISFFFLAHTYAFLLEVSLFLNHAYLISLVAFLLIWIPANRCFAYDARRRPELAAQPTPRWCRFALQAQLAIVYGYGAIAKLNYDWIAGAPIAQWMQNSAARNPWAADIIAAPELVPIISWGGLLFDALIVPALLWRRTRALAVVVSLGFHLSNSILFEIGVFPWMMLAATTLFFAPDWPRRVPLLRDLLRPWDPQFSSSASARWVWVPVGVWLAVQIAMPLRHHLYPGDVAWTEQGALYSWRMKLRSKQGYASFRVRDPQADREWRVFPADELNRRQMNMMVGHPELILQYAHHLAEREGQRLGHPVEVRADVFTSLNYREPQRLIDPERDLAGERASLRAYDWILPFEWTEPPRPDYSRE